MSRDFIHGLVAELRLEDADLQRDFEVRARGLILGQLLAATPETKSGRSRQVLRIAYHEAILARDPSRLEEFIGTPVEADLQRLVGNEQATEALLHGLRDSLPTDPTDRSATGWSVLAGKLSDGTGMVSFRGLFQDLWRRELPGGLALAGAAAAWLLLVAVEQLGVPGLVLPAGAGVAGLWAARRARSLRADQTPPLVAGKDLPTEPIIDVAATRLSSLAPIEQIGSFDDNIIDWQSELSRRPASDAFNLLVRFMIDAFDRSELKEFCPRLPDGGDLFTHLPGEMAPLATVAIALIEGVISRGLLDANFFEHLRAARPRKSAQIDRIRQELLSTENPAEASGPRPESIPPITGDENIINWQSELSLRPKSDTFDLLVRFMSNAFSQSELIYFAQTLPEGDDLITHLPGEIASPAHVTIALIEAVIADGLLDNNFFEHLRAARPGRSAQIDRIRQLLLSTENPAEASDRARGHAVCYEC